MRARLYGIAPADILGQHRRQGGRCAICDVAVTVSGRDIAGSVVDHDHGTGAVRGLLCRSCNQLASAIDRLSGAGCDVPTVLERATAYVQTGGVFGREQVEAGL